MDVKTNFEVIVVGAGASGLLIAQGLKLNGIKATVYERESATTYLTRPREWGMSLHFGQNSLSKCIPPNLMSRMNEALCDPYDTERRTSWPLYNGQTGEKFFDMPGHNPIRVSHRKLRALLSEGIDIRYGKRLVKLSRTEASSSATATFADGDTATAALIVGCEGAHSAVREALVGRERAVNTPIDVQVFNACWRLPADVALLQRKDSPVFRVGYHPVGMTWVSGIQDVKDPGDPTTFLFQQLLSWPGRPHAEDFPDQRSKVEFVKEKARIYAEPWKSAGLNIPEDTELHVDRIAIWKPDVTVDWASSCPLWPHVAVAGDAAHSMPPFRGQGLNNALTDAERIVSELVEVKHGIKSLGEAVRSYESEMKARGAKEVEISTVQSRMVHNWDTLMGSPMMKAGMDAYKGDVGEYTKYLDKKVGKQAGSVS
ncbi:hypothetical protein LTS17_009950 [Exophiala oligosperma]